MEKYTSYEFIIFDRWGNKIFETYCLFLLKKSFIIFFTISISIKGQSDVIRIIFDILNFFAAL